MNNETFTTNLMDTNAGKAVTDAFFDPALHLLDQVQFYFKYAVIAIGVFGTAANALVLYALITHNARDIKKRAINFMIINQNLLDLSCCFFLVITISIEVNNIYITGAFGYFLCAVLLNGTATHCALYGSIINLVGLTFERYLKIVYPFWSKKHLKRWVVRVAMAFAWIGGIVTSAPVSIMTLHVQDGMCFSYFDTSEANMTYGICSIILFFFLPLFIFIYCYGHIVVVIRRQINDCHAGVKLGDPA